MSKTFLLSQTLAWTLLRVGIGILFIRFGWGKITGGAATWGQLGGTMKQVYGIGAFPVFWGFMAALAEFGGGLSMLLGLFVRPFASIMAFTMITAVAMQVKGGADLMKYGHALTLAIVCTALLIGGGGSMSLGAMIPGLRDRWFR